MSFDVLFLWIMSLLLPVVAIIAGVVMWKYPPKKISHTIGYRKRRSKQSQEAWYIAQKLFGEYFLLYGIILLIAVPFLLVCKGALLDPYMFLLVLVIAELILMAVSTLAVECQLKIMFSK